MKTMEKRLQGKVALITGAASGIGKETALLFAVEGASVVVADINGAAGEHTVEMIRASGGQASYVNIHVAREKDCQHMIEVAEQTYGQLHIVFNNAGIMHPQDGNLQVLEEKIWDMTMSVNVKGVYLSCKHAIPALLRAGGGSVINAASFVALRGAGEAKMAYTASKGAVLSLTRDLAAQYAKNNIRFNALCPGPVLTEAFQTHFMDDKKQNYLNKIPLKRFGEPKEIAKAALYLASDESSYVTGSTFTIDGGMTAVL